MYKVTFWCFDTTLNKSFINTKVVKSMSDFRLYACSMWSGNWKITKVENIG